MKITTVGRQMSIPDDLKELFVKKLSKYDKYFRDDAVAYITLSRSRNLERVELTISSNGTLFRSEKENSTFNNALDECLAAIERQIRKNKTRLEKRLRDGAFARTTYPDEVDEEPAFRVRVKNFTIEPMTTDDAILQMNLLGHDFYVFRDADTEKTCVVYRRADDDYGLIVTT